MLYEKNQNAHLEESLFRNPTSEYRGTPFWAWNCQLDQDELLRQLEVFREMGFGGGHMHVRTGMATPYLSKEFMDLIRACVEKAKQEKMLSWLYDEDRWPSGAAGGLVTKDPQYRARYLLFTARPYEQEEQRDRLERASAAAARTGNGRLLACYDVQLDEKGCLRQYRRIDAAEKAVGCKWYAYLETPDPSPWYNNQTYVNTLDKAAMDRFIEVTYEAYWKAVGDEFGKNIPSIFTDEPQFTHKSTLAFAEEKRDVTIPWTDDVPQTYAESYGEEILDKLPELFWELPEGRVSVSRYHYHDHIAERFTRAFADNCGKWCEEHGLALTGHMMNEPSLASQTAALGEAMRSYRSFAIPGIDMLCASFEFTTAKQTQSAVHQYGREAMLSELYGVTGWAFDFRGHKLHGDWQAALGVTIRVPHLAWVSMAGEAKRDYPASISYQSPWWKEYSCIEDHFSRVNTAMTRGTPVVRVGVIHPVESYWLHWGPTDQTSGIRERMDRNFQDLTEWLLKGSIDFDFISESLLPDLCKKAGNPLQVGKMAYDAVIVPGCETLRTSTLERLEAFRAAGGRLIFLGDAPSLENAAVSQRGRRLYEKSESYTFTESSVLDALEDVRLLDIRVEGGSRVIPGARTRNLVHQLRQDHGCKWLFVAHACEPYNKDVSCFEDVKLILNGIYTPVLYDTVTGETGTVAYTYENGNTVIRTRLYDYDSLLLRLDEKAGTPLAAALPTAQTVPVSVPTMVDYTLDEPNVLMLDVGEFRLDEEPWQPREEILRADNLCREKLGWPTRKEAVAQPWVIASEPSVHTFSVRFCVNSEMAISGVQLALEEAEDAVITCNGIRVPSRITGWWTDKSIKTVALPEIGPGQSVIEITWPFGKRTNPEWCYLLGQFGVKVLGQEKILTTLPKQLAFDDITVQGLPFYGGNVTYHIPVSTSGGRLQVNVPHYAGALMKLAVDGNVAGRIVYPPYTLSLDGLDAGTHRLDLTLYGNRQNCFGAVHLADQCLSWLGPPSWRTEGDSWTYEYRLTPIGVRTAPRITEEL